MLLIRLFVVGPIQRSALLHAFVRHNPSPRDGGLLLIKLLSSPKLTLQIVLARTFSNRFLH